MWQVIVMVVLFVLLLLSVFLTIILLVKLLRRSHRHKDFVVSLPKVSSPRYVANPDTNVLGTSMCCQMGVVIGRNFSMVTGHLIIIISMIMM